MVEIAFFKVHGLRNDFILVDALAEPARARLDWPALAPKLCHRHTGIGADGILVVQAPGPGVSADAAMRIINADGSDGGMCGNGIRCVARHLVVHHRRATTLRIGTARGVLPVTCSVDGPGFMATVDMGEPVLEPARIPVRLGGERAVDAAITLAIAADDPKRGPALESLGKPARATVDGLEVRIAAVSMGNPHAVVFIADAARLPLEVLGPAMEHHPAFPQRVNAQFLEVTGPARAKLRTWERGAGATLACGTGACAALVAGVLAGRLERRAEIRVPGGPLLIEWDAGTNRVAMTGPAEETFSGNFSL